MLIAAERQRPDGEIIVDRAPKIKNDDTSDAQRTRATVAEPATERPLLRLTINALRTNARQTTSKPAASDRHQKKNPIDAAQARPGGKTLAARMRTLI